MLNSRIGMRGGSAIAALSLCALISFGSPSNAVTIGFDGPDVTPYVESGFTIDVARIVNGNCLDAPCMALNDNESSTLSQVGGGAFTLEGFWFQLLGMGNPNALTVTAFSGATIVDTFVLSVPTFDPNVGHFFTTPVADITSVLFDTIGGGNVRIDDIVVTPGGPGVVPTPAAAFLMGSVLAAGAGFGVWRRRRKSAA